MGCRCDTRSLWSGEIAKVIAKKKTTPQPVQAFSALDIKRLLQQVRDERTKLKVIGKTEFPRKTHGSTGQSFVARHYWLELYTLDASLAGHDGLAILGVHYAGKWDGDQKQRDRSVIRHIDLRRTVPQETVEPGVNAHWHKCKELDKWMQRTTVTIFSIPPDGWRWREQRVLTGGARWDNGFAPVIHDLLMDAEQCTRFVR